MANANAIVAAATGSAGGGGDYSAAVLADSPAFVLPMDEASGNLTDIVGAKTGTVSGTPTYGATGPVTGHTAIDFSASTQYFTFGDHNDLDIDLTTSGLTLEVWHARDTDSGTWEVWGWKGTNGWEIGVSNADRFFTGKGGVGYTAIASPTIPADGSWHHYVATIAQNPSISNDTLLYIDGVETFPHANDSARWPTTTALPAIIGTETTVGTKGKLAYFALYKSVLTPTRIAAHYNAATVVAAAGAKAKVKPSALLAAATGAGYVVATAHSGNANAQLAAATGAGVGVDAKVKPSALLAAGTGAGAAATASTGGRANALRAWASGTAAAAAHVRQAVVAAGTGTGIAATASSGTNPSGQVMPTGNLPGWQLLFNDDFTTPIAEGQFPAATGGRWTAYPDTWDDTSNYGWYGGPIVSWHDSVMDIFCRYLNGKWQVAGPEPYVMNRALGRTNVRIATRFRADPVQGFKTAWLLWPMSNNWPRDGEIDFPEGNLHGAIEGYMHRQDATVGSDQDWRGSSATYSSWHTAVLEWVAGQSCAFYMDDVLLAPVITSRVPNTPMRYVMQTETWMTGSPPPTGAQAHVLIDWVAIWGASTDTYANANAIVAAATGSAGGGGDYSAAVLADSPSAYWRLGEPSGTYANDEIGTADGTYIGTPTLGVTGALTGDSNTGVGFNGSTQRVSVADQASLDVGDAPWSFEAWAQRDTTGAFHALFDKGAGTPWFGVNSTNKLVVYKDGEGLVGEQAGTFPTDASYHHCVATFNGTTLLLYIDGADVSGTTTDRTFASSASPLAIGGIYSGVQEWWDGKLDEAAVYGTVLTPTQVAAHYSAGTGGGGTSSGIKVKPSGLVASATGAANAATIPSLGTNANAQVAAGTGTGVAASKTVKKYLTAAAAGTGTGVNAVGRPGGRGLATVAAGTGAAGAVTAKVKATPTVAAGTGTGRAPAPKVKPYPTVAAGTGTGKAPAPKVKPYPTVAAGTGTGKAVTSKVKATPSVAAGTGASANAVARPGVKPTATVAAGTGAGANALGRPGTRALAVISAGSGTGVDALGRPGTRGLATVAAATGTGANATVTVTSGTFANAVLAEGAGAGVNATVTTVATDTADAGEAVGSGAAGSVSSKVKATIGTAASTGTGVNAVGRPGTRSLATVAAATGTANTASHVKQATVAAASGTAVNAAGRPGGRGLAVVAAGTGIGKAPASKVKPTALASAGTGGAANATISTSSAVQAPAGVAAGTGAVGAAAHVRQSLVAAGTGVAANAVGRPGAKAAATVAAATGAAGSAGHVRQALVAAPTGAAANATVTTTTESRVYPTVAASGGAAANAAILLKVVIGQAIGTGTANNPSAGGADTAPAGTAAGTGTGNNATSGGVSHAFAWADCAAGTGSSSDVAIPTLRGRTLDERGYVIPLCTVDAFVSATNLYVGTTTSSALGNYAIVVVPGVDYYLVAYSATDVYGVTARDLSA